jgi:hypothetical protein
MLKKLFTEFLKSEELHEDYIFTKDLELIDELKLFIKLWKWAIKFNQLSHLIKSYEQH